MGREIKSEVREAGSHIMLEEVRTPLERAAQPGGGA